MPVKTDKPAISRRVARALQYLTEPQDDGTIMRPTAVAQTIAERFRVHISTAWLDVKAAQNEIAKASLADLPGMKLYLVAELKDCVDEAKAAKDTRARVAAAKELAKITGANAPQQVELSAKAGVMVVAGVAPTPEQWAASHAGNPASSTPPPSNGKANGHSNGNGAAK